MIRIVIAVGCGLLAVVSASGQTWDAALRAGDWISAETEGRLKLTFESRGRYESRTGTNFGRDVDIDTGLLRTRLGLSYQPVNWLKISAMVQDSRAPWYGEGAPNTVRDEADLHEGYIELFPGRKAGFGMTAGRMMLNYGESRLLGTPQWGNVARTYDHARMYYKIPKGQVEFLLVSPAKIRSEEFNRPVLGDRIWGAYNAFTDVYKKHGLDLYVLRHEQNRPGGFSGGDRKTGTDRLGVNTFGFRAFGPVSASLKYSTEVAVQTGNVGAAEHHAHAFFGSMTRRWHVAARAFDVSGEYKSASGSREPRNAAVSGTFDQLYAANHDKFGHEDLFGWRNIRNARGLATLAVTKSIALNVMYDSFWIASERDALYSGSGKALARSPVGDAGRHVGEEADVFGTYKYRHLIIGAGYGHLFAGEFIRKTTPGFGPTYIYVFHTYGF